MADKTIGELPAASEVYDDSLLVMEQQGEARSVQGALIKKYAREATASYVEEAKGHADDAKGQAEAAQASADAAAESARDAADVALHPPTLKDENDHWWIWDTGLNDYKDSGIDAGVSLEVVEEVIVGEPGSGASVKNLGTKTDPNLQFTVEKGEKGDKGDAATIEVGEVTTGEPGEAASVKNSGTPGAAKLDFVIPKGDTGRGFTILGYYDTAGALEAAVQDPVAGDAYGVGTEKPYDIYIYDADKDWVDNGPIGGVPELPQHLAVADGDEVPATVTTLHDHDTGEAIAPRTVVGALSGEGSEGDYVGFTADNQIGVIKKGAWPCNPNLLDNWYFVGGGSQKGDRHFPINQKGQTSYTDLNNQIGIDRWNIETRGGSISLGDDGIVFNPKDGALTFMQKMEVSVVSSYLIDKQLTLSVLMGDGLLYSITDTITAEDISDAHLIIRAPNFSVAANYLNSVPQIIRFFVIPGNTATLAAIKLELGDQQTLAHKEGDKWVVNEIPDYATELAKCQRYMYVISPNPNWISSPIGEAYIDLTNTKNIQWHLTLPVDLRVRPTVTVDPSEFRVRLWLYSNNPVLDVQSIVTYIAGSLRGEGHQYNIWVSSTTDLTGGAFGYILSLSTPFKMILDANL